MYLYLTVVSTYFCPGIPVCTGTSLRQTELAITSLGRDHDIPFILSQGTQSLFGETTTALYAAIVMNSASADK